MAVRLRKYEALELRSTSPYTPPTRFSLISDQADYQNPDLGWWPFRVPMVGWSVATVTQ